jgi:hypothetical protein
MFRFNTAFRQFKWIKPRHITFTLGISMIGTGMTSYNNDINPVLSDTMTLEEIKSNSDIYPSINKYLVELYYDSIRKIFDISIDIKKTDSVEFYNTILKNNKITKLVNYIGDDEEIDDFIQEFNNNICELNSIRYQIIEHFIKINSINEENDDFYCSVGCCDIDDLKTAKKLEYIKENDDLIKKYKDIQYIIGKKDYILKKKYVNFLKYFDFEHTIEPEQNYMEYSQSDEREKIYEKHLLNLSKVKSSSKLWSSYIKPLNNKSKPEESSFLNRINDSFMSAIKNM